MSDNQRNRKRVLIVDFREIIADTLETIFGENGYDARAAYTAKDALKIAEAWEPDVLITDGKAWPRTSRHYIAIAESY